MRWRDWLRVGAGLVGVTWNEVRAAYLLRKVTRQEAQLRALSAQVILREAEEVFGRAITELAQEAMADEDPRALVALAAWLPDGAPA